LLTNIEIMRVVNSYIGVNGGYLGNFSYRTHKEFYPMYCGLNIDPESYSGATGTTRERFIHILRTSDSPAQAKILRGVLEFFPVDTEFNTQDRARFRPEIEEMIQRLEEESSPVVSAPSLSVTSDVVERAIADAQALIESTGATSAVDRVHTQLHGYLKEVCRQAGIAFNNDANITAIFREIRAHHPRFQSGANTSQNIDRMIRSLGGILDVFNPIRNRESMSHPNEVLLDESEAILFINVARSILQYINTKLK